MFKSMLLIGMTIALLGCGTVPQVNTVVKDRIVAPEDAMLVDCVIAAPPAKEDYLKVMPTALATLEERERLLTLYAKTQTDNLAQCNIRWQAVRQWKKQVSTALAAPSP